MLHNRRKRNLHTTKLIKRFIAELIKRMSRTGFHFTYVVCDDVIMTEENLTTAKASNSL